MEKVNVLLFEYTDTGIRRFKKLCEGLELNIIISQTHNVSLVKSVIKENEVKIIVTELGLSGQHPDKSLHFLEKIQEACPKIPVIVWTKYEYYREAAQKLGIEMFILKFNEDKDLAGKIQSLLFSTPA
jgi:DNA-binding NarL/FixJ family response regulator